jgi:hypothetical protein
MSKLSQPSASKREPDFQAYHREHPEVFDKLVKLALNLKSRGIEHYGLRALLEVVGYHGVVSASRVELGQVQPDRLAVFS